MTVPHTGAAAPATRVLDRIDGLDIARFLALAGMFATHVWFVGPDGVMPAIPGAISGKAAALFAVLAGIGIVLSTRRYLADGRLGAARLALLGRGAALIAIGLTLGLVSNLVLVILVYYGVMFWLAIPLLTLRPRTLVMGAIAWAIVWPVVAYLIMHAFGFEREGLASPSWIDLLKPGHFLVNLLLTGGYPALAWMVYPVVGMAIGKLLLERQNAEHASGVSRLRAWGVRMGVLGTGIALATLLINQVLVRFVVAPAVVAANSAGSSWAGSGAPSVDALLASLRSSPTGVGGTKDWWRLFSTAPHTATPFDLLITAGVAIAVIGVCLAAAARLGPTARKVLAPVLGAGSAPLTVYVGHVVAASIGFAVSMMLGLAVPMPWWVSSWQLWLIHLAAALVFGAILRASGRRGPLETFVTWAGRRAARLAEPKPPQQRDPHPQPSTSA